MFAVFCVLVDVVGCCWLYSIFCVLRLAVALFAGGCRLLVVACCLRLLCVCVHRLVSVECCVLYVVCWLVGCCLPFVV